MRPYYFTILILCLFTSISWGQSSSIQGYVYDKGKPIEFASIYIDSLQVGAITNSNGYFKIAGIPTGDYRISAKFLGYQKEFLRVEVKAVNTINEVVFQLKKSTNLMNEIVITGTKTEKRQSDSPIIVNVINSATLSNVQACNLADGLKFQPGLRVETDCQTCNYTQLRMNGLGGGYSQILINGRPIFSPLTGLYGLEQIPANMVDRIEVVRGGGSSLYGSSAIGGTVNVITKIPKKNAYAVNYFYQNINGSANDQVLSANASILNKNKKLGATLFLNFRDREMYDHNADNFSELPLLNTGSVGSNLFYLINANQKLELNLSYTNEYRFGGEMINVPAHETQQSEERLHKVWMGSIDYQWNFNDNKSTLILYAAGQQTVRDHYTGILPDSTEELIAFQNNPPYGNSLTQTVQGGFQFNHKLRKFLKGTNVLTLGGEYVVDDVYDEIPAYHYLVDQTTKDLGVFLQSDWEIFDNLNLLSGVRMDDHNFLDNLVFSPRLSLLYKLKENTQFRLNYGTGFRAPQAFDTDLHIAFAGGGVSRVILSPELLAEKSNSWSTSINYDKPTEHFIAGFTLEGFYTRLNNAFFLQPIGQDEFGAVFEKQNGQGATVKGVTLELRANYDKKIQLETGTTFQKSEFDEAVIYIDGLAGIKAFTRTPNVYGFGNITFTPNKKWTGNINYVYTGPMQVPHFAGAPNQLIDEMFMSQNFHEWNFKLSYTVIIPKLKNQLECYGGIKNVLNAYQSDFDIGKNRDSNFIYGPGLPRTFYLGIKLKTE